MKSSLFSFLAPLLVSHAFASITVKTPDVDYVGVAANGTESFLGIPFAESVSGSKRFTKATPKQWSKGSNFDATQPGPACPQAKVPVASFPVFSNVTNAQEDCLTLRVDRPANIRAGSKLPVMVYIYGGEPSRNEQSINGLISDYFRRRLHWPGLRPYLHSLGSFT